MRLNSPFRPRSPRGRRSLRRFALRVGACGLAAAPALVAAGCSVKGSDNANLIVGKQQFVAKCGSCHTLARASTRGIVGPNLDEAFRAGVGEAHGRTEIRGLVEYQIRFPNPEGVMPKDLLRGAAVPDVSAYVAAVAANPGADTGLLASAVQAPGAGKPVVEKAGKLQIEASPSGQLAYVTAKASAAAGRVTVEMPNTSGVSHNIAIQQGTSGAVLAASSFTTKGTAAVSVSLKPGTYTYFCQAPGHRQAGMLGTLTVK